MVCLVLNAPASGQEGAEKASADLLRIAFPQEDGSLTPYTFEVGYPLLTLVYDTLMWRDAQGIPQPLLARAVEPSADGVRITIRLAPGAQWHDGRPVTSGDVAFTFRFMAERPHPRFTPQLESVTGVETPDPATAVVTLRAPSPGFTDQPLADVPIIPAHIWSTLPPGMLAPEGLPVGSGPYRLVEHVPDERYRFEANPGYFRGAPAVRVLEVPIIPAAEQTFLALERRRVDMIPVNLPSGTDDRLERVGAKISRGTSYLGTALLLNTRRAPFDRLEVRQAVARSLDVQRVSRSVGDVVPADRGFLHPESQWAGETLSQFDEKSARADIVRLGIPPFRVLTADNDPAKLDAARQVALALQRAGLQVVSEQRPRAEVSRALGEDGAPPTYEAAIGAISPLISYDPDFLRPFFGGGDTSRLNVTGYRSAEFDQLAEGIRSSADAEQRRIAVSTALQLLATDAPAIPLFFNSGAFAYRDAAYEGWVFIKGTGILDRRSFVEPATIQKRAPTEVVPETSTDQGPPVFGLAAAAILVAALLLALVALLRRS